MWGRLARLMDALKSVSLVRQSVSQSSVSKFASLPHSSLSASGAYPPP